jgi:hypothetical protein
MLADQAVRRGPISALHVGHEFLQRLTVHGGSDCHWRFRRFAHARYAKKLCQATQNGPAVEPLANRAAAWTPVVMVIAAS